MGIFHAHHDFNMLPSMRTMSYTIPKPSVNSACSKRGEKGKNKSNQLLDIWYHSIND